MIGAFLTLAVAATTAAFDSTSYVVLNHGRRAGDMTVVTTGDSTVARWIFTDRNRGTRLETRYRYNAAKRSYPATSVPSPRTAARARPCSRLKCAVTRCALLKGPGRHGL